MAKNFLMGSPPESENIIPASHLRSLTLKDALDEVGVGFFSYRMLLLCGLGFAVDSLEVNFLFFLTVCAGDSWNLSTTQMAGLNSSVFIGILIGWLFWGDISTRLGRRWSFIIGCGLIAGGGFLTGLAPNLASLIIFRTICGFGVVSTDMIDIIRVVFIIKISDF
jgi:putative MFS transporter